MELSGICQENVTFDIWIPNGTRFLLGFFLGNYRVRQAGQGLAQMLLLTYDPETAAPCGLPEERARNTLGMTQNIVQAASVPPLQKDTRTGHPRSRLERTTRR
jgi:hypothetical protein